MRTSLLKKLILIALFLTLSRSAYAVTYAGSLQVPSTSGVSGTGLWAEVFKISWSIAQQPDTSWNYSYSLTELNGDPLDPGAVSHFILEISPAATASDFWGFGGKTEFGSFGASPSNPGIPGTLSNAIKFDYTATTYSFSSTKAPVWGDFYSKDGNAGGKGTNAVWNADFLDPDPLDAPKTGLLSDGNGGYIYKLLRPDTTNGGGGGSTPSVPEPITSVLVSLGLAAPAVKKFLRRKRGV